MLNFFKKIFLVFKNMHFQSLIANGLMSVFGMVTLSILYRSLSVVEIGIYIFFLSILGLIDSLRAGFLTISFVKFFSGTDENRSKEVAGSAWLLALLVAGIFIIINIPTYFIANYVNDEGLKLFLKYFALVSIITLPCFMADCAVQASKRFDRLFWLRIFVQGSYTLIVFILSFLGKLNLNTVLYTYFISNLFSSLIVLTLNWAMLTSIKFATKSTVLELFHFGKYSMGTNISSSLFSVTSTFVINFLIGPAALAMYNLGGKLIQIIEIPLLSFATSGMPLLSGYYNKNEPINMIYTLKKLIGMLTIALIPIVLIAVVFAEPIIHLLGGQNYVNNAAPNLFRIFMIIALIYPLDRFFSLGLDVIHKPKVNFYKILVMLIANVFSMFIAVSIFHSVYAVAIVSVIPTLISVFIGYYPLNNYFKFSILSIYDTGFKEVIIFLKNINKTFFKAV